MTEESLELLYRKGPVLNKLSPKAGHGQTPGVLLINPKYPHNVGAALRACSCYGVEQLWYTGNRVSISVKRGFRLPREERMRGYASVTLFQYDYPFDQFTSDVTPVAVEVKPNFENLVDFIHPPKPLYVFGPEDGSIPRSILSFCHRFVTIPTKHCLNLSASVYTVLYDRYTKSIPGN